MGKIDSFYNMKYITYFRSKMTELHDTENVITIKYSDIISKQATINIGTIGHVSHGKTTTVGQLTGERTQKHEKEIIENKTIHIGYANSKVWRCPETGDVCCTPATLSHKVSEKSGKPMELIANISFVDCPGHADFMCTMIGGTSAMDAVFLLIAANDTVFPQNQTKEHMLAMATTDVSNYLILQNKLDLVQEKTCLQNYKDISKFVDNTPAKDAPIVPISAQLGQNMNIISEYIANGIENVKHDVNTNLRMFILRSFNNNKPNTPTKKLIGGSIGGSIMSGSIQKGDYIEIRPGYLYPLDDDNFACYPIVSKVTSLYCGKEPLDIALPGGLKGVGMEFDPSLSKLNGLAGHIAGTPGTLPKIYSEITFMYKTLNKEAKNQLKKMKPGEKITICVNAKTVPGVVLTMFKENKMKCASVKLSYPICIDTNLNLTILRHIDKQLEICFIAKVTDGVEVENIIYPPIYQEILDNLPKRHIEIDYDISYQKKKNDEYINYFDLMKNITFRNINTETDDRFDMVYPDVTKKNRDSIILNYNEIMESFDVKMKIEKGGNSIKQMMNTLNNMDSEIVNIGDYLDGFIKDELKTSGSIDEKEQLILRGNFNGIKIESIMEKFVKTYCLCSNCNSCNTLVTKQKTKGKIMSIACLKCSATICIK